VTDLSEKRCPSCGGNAIEIIRRENPKERKGWHCMNCGNYDNAIGRERIIAKTDEVK
jgi:uncharacterized Zn finger protein